MADVLSQNEIDALLKQLSSGELDVDEINDEPAVKIKDYDFTRPAKFSKEHLRTLEIIFENFGRLVSSNLPAYLRKNVQVDVMNSEAVTYSEFSNALSNPVLLGIVDFAPLKGDIIIELASNLGFTIIDRMLGGLGDPLEKPRDFSEIELSVLERIETNSQFAQIISPSEMIAIVTINVCIGNVEGLMNVCLPFLTLESIMDKLNTKYWFSTMKNKDEDSYEAFIETAINKAQIPMKVLLGKSTISVMDFINLQVGDIIKLDSHVNDELEVYVGNIAKFKALPGSGAENYAVKVTEIIREE